MSLVVCETDAAITTHLRTVTEENPINGSGSAEKVYTLCGYIVGWDLPSHSVLSDVRCNRCRHSLEEEG